MSEHLIAKKKPWWNDIWWWIRGVGINDYRGLCARCGRPGQIHYHVAGCWRFKPINEQEKEKAIG